MEALRVRASDMMQANKSKLWVMLALLLLSPVMGVIISLYHGYMLLGALIVFDLIVLALVWPEVATLTFMFMLYVNMPAVLVRFHGVPSFFASVFTLFLTIPLASYIIFRRQPVSYTPALPFLGAYLVAQLLSALHSQESNALSWLNSFLTEGLILYFLVTNVIRTPETLRRVVWVLLVAGSLMGALSIYQEVTHTYANNYGGFAQIDKILDSTSTGELIRLAGPIGEKNRYAQVLLVLIPLAFFRIQTEKKRNLKLIATGALLLILSGVLLTYSRGAAVALILMLIVMIGWRYIRVGQVLFVILIVIWLIPVLAPRFIDRVNSIATVQSLFSEGGPQADGAIRGRTTENLAALFVFVDHPIFGVGPGQFFEKYSQEYANQLGIRYLDTTRRAHNLYLEIAADTGLLGLVAFLLILAVTEIRLLRLRRYWLQRNPDFANMVTSFFMSVFAYMASGVFLHLSFERYFWLLIGLANVAIYIFQHDTATATMRATSSTTDAVVQRPARVTS